MKQTRINHRPPAALALALTVLALTATPLRAWSADLELKVENVKSTVGDLRVALYASAADYRKIAVRQVQVAAGSNPISIRIPGLAAGDYAIALFHDRNGNEKLDSNMMGIPTEPYGFSGAARSLMAPATWEQAKFSLAADGAVVTVKLSD